MRLFVSFVDRPAPGVQRIRMGMDQVDGVLHGSAKPGGHEPTTGGQIGTAAKRVKIRR